MDANPTTCQKNFRVEKFSLRNYTWIIHETAVNIHAFLPRNAAKIAMKASVVLSILIDIK